MGKSGAVPIILKNNQFLLLFSNKQESLVNSGQPSLPNVRFFDPSFSDNINTVVSFSKHSGPKN